MESDVLDGNVAGGLLAEVFHADVTAAIVTCASCGASGPVATGVVHLSAMGTVIRCPECAEVVIRCARIHGRVVVDMRGAATLAL
jgi:predicted RNA-binding Zn-ribbon protein involved in translation (DUF1610 family)